MQAPTHMIFGDFDLARATGDPGINISSYHEDHEPFPCTAHTIEVFEAELGYRVYSALEDEYLGFGALFDLQYEQYLQTQGVTG